MKVNLPYTNPMDPMENQQHGSFAPLDFQGSQNMPEDRLRPRIAMLFFMSVRVSTNG